jgi:SAM-dependent methyltransferase
VFINPIEHPEFLASQNGDTGQDLIDAAESPAYQGLYLAEAEVKRKLYNKALDRLESANGGSGTLLDVGSYMGLFMREARGRGWKCKGIEPDRSPWEYSVQTLGLDASHGTLNTCSFPAESFDAVTMLQVLEHVAEPRQTLLQVRQLLRRGGTLLVEVPNIDCQIFRVLGKRHRHFARHHFMFFTPDTLSDLLRQCGFNVIDIVFPVRLISLRLLSFGLSNWYPKIHRLSAPILDSALLRDRVLSLDLHEVVSICARVT